MYNTIKTKVRLTRGVTDAFEQGGRKLMESKHDCDQYLASCDI